MARRKKKDGDNGILSFLFLALIAVIVAVPLVFLGMVCYYWNQQQDALSKGTGAFWLDDAEKTRFAALHETLAHAQQNVAVALARGKQLGLPRNQDGSFSRRSSADKEIAAALKEADALTGRYQSEYEELARLPQQRWEAFKTASVRSRAARMALLTYCTLGLAIYLLSYWKIWEENLFWSIGIISGLVSVVVYGCMALWAGCTFAKRLPAPPLVDMQNLEQF